MFDDRYQLVLQALRDGYGDTRQNFNSWLENDQRLIPIDVSANMGVYGSITIRMVNPKDAPGLFLALEAQAAKNQKLVLINRVKAGDHSVLNALEEIGVDIWQLRAALVIQKIGKVTYGSDDIGNGDLFADTYRDELRYVTEWKRWILWDGKRWAADTREAVRVKAHGLLRHIMPRLALEITEDERRAKYLRHVAASHSSSKIDNMLKEAAASMALSVADLDKDNWLFNLENGTLDCRTGTLKPHDRGDLITKISHCSYNMDAKCPLWDAFLHRIMDGRDELVSFLRRIIGYSLTGSVQEQCLFVLYGGGANGKSTLIATLHHLFGDYGQQAQSSLLMSGKNGNSGNGEDVARLLGVRAVMAIETHEGKTFDEEKVKALTGGDRICARRLYENSFEFAPTHKILLATNHKPKVRGDDWGIWRRLNPIPFDVTITEAEKDELLPDKLKAELDGIMAWAIRGLMEWHREKIKAHPTNA